MAPLNMEALHKQVIAPIDNPNLKDLMSKLFNSDPTQRPTAQEAMQHIYFAGVQ